MHVHVCVHKYTIGEPEILAIIKSGGLATNDMLNYTGLNWAVRYGFAIYRCTQ